MKILDKINGNEISDSKSTDVVVAEFVYGLF